MKNTRELRRQSAPVAAIVPMRHSSAQAIDFAADGVRANAVLPGAVDTPMLDGLRREGGTAELPALKAELAAKTVLGRIGRPEDIAEAVLFLADRNRAGFITGQILIADGGALARLSTE